jgi:acetyl/propionyl-CoA carboxylase alpha subunit
MTGKLVEVRVAVGDVVEPDQVVAVIEAMKMEYRLTAPRGGRVEARGFNLRVSRTVSAIGQEEPLAGDVG